MNTPIKINTNNPYESMGDEFPAEAQAPGEEDEDQDSVVNFASFLQESQELLELLKSLKDISSPLAEKSNRIIAILQKYQEQSQLLDPHLEQIVSTLINYIRPHIDAIYCQAKDQQTNNQAQDPQFVLTVFKLIYHVTKVRGYKTVSKFFPHEVVDLERTFYYLEKQNATDFATWEIIDSSSKDQQTLAERMIKEAKNYLRDSGKSREASAQFLAKFLTRPDMDAELIDFLKWANQTLNDATDHYLISGVYESLVGIFQSGDRNKLLPKIDLIYASAIKPVTSITNKKLSLKLIQRIGLTFLPPRTPKWRYVKRSSSLLQNLNNNSASKAQEDEDDEDYDIPDQIESIIELLLNGLKDRDTVIRWSAAKGLGRVTSRLPLNLAEDVIKSILELYAPGSTDSAWHGASLAIAEQARRGLLLPEQLPGLIPLLVSALNYDEKRGAHSKGANVRDAGCYVAWALARGYEPDILRDHLQLTLASSLIIVALYDREINCRRAAAAAFQEHVGRQGTFPHGIDIITTADYFSLSNRTEAYLTISPKIAEYPEYRKTMIDHLVSVKLEHWDQSIRELTAKTLHNLTFIDPTMFVEAILPDLIPKTVNADINMRHGSILAIAEIIFALAKLQQDNKAVNLSPELQHLIREIVPSIEKARLYRGRGAELIRFAVCKLLESISAANIPVNISDADRANLAQKTQPAESGAKSKLPPIPRKEKSYIQQYVETLEENLKHPQEFVQESAVIALSALYNRYFVDVTPAKITSILDNYLKILSTDPNPASRRGYSLMLGYMPKQFYAPHEQPEAQDKPAAKIFYLPKVVSALIAATVIEEDPEKRDPETRRNAAHAMIHLVSTVSLNETWLDQELITCVYSALVDCLNDYSLDNRGDVGSWVREAATKALKKFIDLLLIHDHASDKKLLTPKMVEEYLLRLVRQSVEKLDKIRSMCCGIVEGLLGLAKKGNVNQTEESHTVQSQTFKYHVTLTELEQFENAFVHEVPYIPNKEEFVSLIQNIEQVRDWLDTSLTFKVFVPLLQFDFYRNSLLTGLVYSMGGVNNTKTLIQDSSTNTLEFLRGLKHREDGISQAEKIATALIQVLKDNEKDDRIVVSLLRTLEYLLLNDAFALVNNTTSPFAQTIYSMTFNTVKASKDVNKLLAAAGIFAGLMSFSSVKTQCMTRLLSFLGHTFPKIRKTAAEQFYLQLEVNEELIDASKVEEVKEILLTTQWIEKTELSKPRRMNLYDILGIARPVLVSQAQAAANTTKTE